MIDWKPYISSLQISKIKKSNKLWDIYQAGQTKMNTKMLSMLINDIMAETYG